jgi:hypothetical protein
MGIVNPFAQAGYIIQRSLGIWLSIWAVRYGMSIDYRLGIRGKVTRWAAVLLCFGLTAVPGSKLGWFRIICYLVGLAFLCWPNLAYYLSKGYQEWPTIEGRINSVEQQQGSSWVVGYDFELGGERYGGRDTVKNDPGHYADVSREDARVLIRYDPLNPGRSSRIQAADS